MKRLLIITAFDRPGYFSRTIDSWRGVDFLDWDVQLRLEPDEAADIQKDIFLSQIAPRVRGECSVLVNPFLFGVLVHPWAAFEAAFDKDYDFVVRAEDDLLVSNDILRFFDFASERWKQDSEASSVHAYSPVLGDSFQVSKGGAFNPLVWGTWRDRWDEYIGPTWDKDYSTHNGIPGVCSGWDWNLKQRVLPELGKRIVISAQSRVQNIGIYGVHGTADNFEQAPGWVEQMAPGVFWSND